MTSRRTAILALSLVVSASRIAHATHVEPAQAKKAQFTLVNGQQCLTANTATQSGNIPACTPPVTAQACALTATGSGKLSMAVIGSGTTQDLKLAASVKGLNQLCESEQLCVSLSFRATSDDCPEGSCTTEDILNDPIGFGTGCCTVTGGTCKIKTTLSASAPGLFANGKNTGIEILGCGLVAIPPGGFNPPGLSCGLLLK